MNVLVRLTTPLDDDDDEDDVEAPVTCHLGRNPREREGGRDGGLHE